MANNNKQVRKQIEKILKLRVQYRTAKQAADQINKRAGVEMKKLEKLLR